jgi:hypothetical protein
VKSITSFTLIAVVSVVIVVAVSGMSGHLPASLPQPPARTSIVSEMDGAGMLESDMQMLEWMRAATSPPMNRMTGLDPMWVDPAMIRGQEQYQAQIDRMLGSR